MSEKSYGKQIKVPVGSIPKAHTWLPDGALASEVQNCGCKQASGAYTAVAQDAKMEILGIVSPIREFHPPAPASGFAVDHTERSQAKLGDMKRVVILGPGASGKSTLAVRLGEITGLSVIELDKIFWRPGLVPTPRDQWVKIQQMLVEENGWIMDGDLGPYDAVEVRLRAADTLIFLDFSLVRCTWRALRRSRERADFWLSLLRYRRQSRPVLMDAIADHAANATFHVLRNPEALRRFVADVVRKYRAGQPRPGS